LSSFACRQYVEPMRKWVSPVRGGMRVSLRLGGP
jgi:hypothetical protein